MKRNKKWKFAGYESALFNASKRRKQYIESKYEKQKEFTFFPPEIFKPKD